MAKKMNYTALKILCLHHLLVRKKILAPSPLNVKWSTSESPEIEHPSMNGVEKESPKIRTVINQPDNHLQNY